MASTAVLSSKGQVVIPAALRRELGFRPGARLHFSRKGRKLVVESADMEEVLALCGSCKSVGWEAEEYLMEQRRKDRAQLEAEL